MPYLPILPRNLWSLRRGIGFINVINNRENPLPLTLRKSVDMPVIVTLDQTWTTAFEIAWFAG